MTATSRNSDQEVTRNRSCLSTGKLLSVIEEDFSYLHFVVFRGRSDLVRSCLGRCQDAEELLRRTDVYRRTPFHVGAMQGHYDCLKVLSQRCTEKSILNAQDCYKYTALHYTAQNAQTYCTKLLLDNGVDPDVAQHSNSTALHLAAVNGLAQTVMLLCRHGADVHARNLFGETPLLMASRSGIAMLERLKEHTTVLAILLRFGSDVKAHDNEGMTSLHHVAMLCSGSACARILCAAGASPTAENAFSRTAVDLARAQEVRALLRSLARLPLRLDQQCLLCIRRNLGSDLDAKVATLPLSSTLKDRLLFKAMREIN